jgi:hypothetical protein
MNAQEFVSAIRTFVMVPAVSDTVAAVRSPPGRRPASELKELSAWFGSLSNHDQVMVERMLEMVAQGAVFGVLAVIDGARKVASSKETPEYFELRHMHGTTQDILSGPNGELLHELL